MSWRDYAPDDPNGLRPFVEHLIEETFTKPLKNEVAGKPFETYEEAYARVMKELKEHCESFNSKSKRSLHE